MVELHTGAFANAHGPLRTHETEKLVAGALAAHAGIRRLGWIVSLLVIVFVGVVIVVAVDIVDYDEV